MANDIFISYSSKDVKWAEVLEEKLRQRGFTVFRDKTRLIAGKEWEEQLRQNLESSQHMIVLWSEHARNSDWVAKEAGYFDIKYHSDAKKFLFFIVLDDEPRAYSSLHGIYDIKESGFYNQGADAMPKDLWEKLLKKLQDGLGQNDPRKPIWRLILSSTKEEINQLNFDNLPQGEIGESLTNIFNNFNISKNEVVKRYGAKRGDWKPLGGNKNIIEILDKMLDEINQNNGVNYRWREVDEEIIFSTDQQKIERELNQLADSLCVVVIDPISLYNGKIIKRFQMCNKCFENKNASIIPFFSFEHAPDFLAWRKIIENGASDFYKFYFAPPIPKKNLLAQFNANPVDINDARRLIQRIVSEDASDEKSTKPEVLRP